MNDTSRWNIVGMAKPQNVAAHTAVVTHVCLSLSAFLEVLESPGERLSLLHAALFHDAPEIYTGDIPSPAKRDIGQGHIDRAENELCPAAVDVKDQINSMACGPMIWAILHAADTFEGYTHALFYGAGPMAGEATRYMREAFREATMALAMLRLVEDGVPTPNVEMMQDTALQIETFLLGELED
jgi:hypothetical protein